MQAHTDFVSFHYNGIKCLKNRREAKYTSGKERIKESHFCFISLPITDDTVLGKYRKVIFSNILIGMLVIGSSCKKTNSVLGGGAFTQEMHLAPCPPYLFIVNKSMSL